MALTVKIPRTITHEKKLRDWQSDISSFLSVFQRLNPKLKCLLARLPPSSSYEDDLTALAEFVSNSKDSLADLRVAVELRSHPFFRDENSDMLGENDVCVVWAFNQYMRDFPPKVTGELLYVRFIGDRRLVKFDRVQIDRTQVLEEFGRGSALSLTLLTNLLCSPITISLGLRWEQSNSSKKSQV